MRILHTSDWHIGRMMKGGEERWEEVSELLGEIGSYAETERIDLVLISGDVFDVLTPPAEAERLVYEFFCRMNRCSIPVVVIAGNHDSGQRFESRAGIFQIAGVHVIGYASKDAVIRPRLKCGERAIVGAIPFLSEKSVIRGIDFMQKSETELKGTYTDRIEKIIQVLSGNFQPDAVNVLMTHLYFERSVPSGTEREIDLTNAYAVPSQLIPSQVNYFAVGHIHKQQKIRKTGIPAYYSGSIMKLDFGEEKDEKGFLVIEAKPGIPAQVEFIPLNSVRNLLNFQIAYEDLIQKADEINRQIGPNGYAKIRIVHDQPLMRLREMVRQCIPRAFVFEQINPRPVETNKPSYSYSALADPIQMFNAYFEENMGKKPDQEMLEAVRTLYQEVASDETN